MLLEDASDHVLVDRDPERMQSAPRQPKRGLRRFISTTAAINSSKVHWVQGAYAFQKNTATDTCSAPGLGETG